MKVASFEKLKSDRGLIWKVEVWSEPGLVYYNMKSFICLFSQRSYTKVRGRLRSSCKMGWKCKIHLIWKLKSYWNQTWFIDIMWEPSYTHEVKCHITRSKVTWGQVVRLKIWNCLTWKDKVWLEPNLVYGCTMGTFICSWRQQSQIKVKDHLRSTFKIVWKC